MIPLLILLLLAPTQNLADAYQTWDRLSWEYRLPPASIQPSTGSSGEYAGVDEQGRARIFVDPGLHGEQVTGVVAHEAVHALLDPSGMSVEKQHEWADSFSVCVGIGRETKGTAMKSCSEVREFFHNFHR